MRHLDDAQMVDAAELRLQGAEAAHLEACEACRAEVQTLQGVLSRAATADIPDPSPLFWEHFRARLGRELDPVEPLAVTARPGFGFRWLAAAASVLTVALVILTAVVPREKPLVSEVVIGDELDEDDAWALVRSLADDLDYDSARDAGIAPAPNAVDRAALELSPAEQSAFIRLLEEEMKRTDS